jgi:hypothetical protein
MIRVFSDIEQKTFFKSFRANHGRGHFRIEWQPTTFAFAFFTANKNRVPIKTFTFFRRAFHSTERGENLNANFAGPQRCFCDLGFALIY